MSPEERKNFKKICIMPGERNTSRPRPIPTFANIDTLQNANCNRRQVNLKKHDFLAVFQPKSDNTANMTINTKVLSNRRQ